MPFGLLTSLKSSNRARRHRLLLSALTVIGGGLSFSVFPLSAQANGSQFCKFGSPASSLYQSLLPCSGQGPVTLGDKKLTLNAPVGAADPSLYQLPTVGNGAIKFSWQPIGTGDGYLNDVWSVSVDFDPDVFASSVGPATVSGAFKYTLDVVDNNWEFATVDLDSVKTQTGGTVVVKKLLPDGTLAPDGPLISTNGSNVDPVAFAGDTMSIAVTDTYDLTAGAGTIILDNFQNNFTQQLSGNIPPTSDVPGPLPLLGAGAAFGFSRRLRSRLLVARRG